MRCTGVCEERALLVLVQQFLELASERRKVCRDDFPQNIVVHSIVTVNQTVACSDDLPPRKIGMRVLSSRGDARRRLADDLD